MSSISMSPSAHYVTQQGLYTSPLLGPLTNRRIKHYQKLGYYASNAVFSRVEERKKIILSRTKFHVKRKPNALKALLDSLL